MSPGGKKLPDCHHKPSRTGSAEIPIPSVSKVLNAFRSDRDFDGVALPQRTTKAVSYSFEYPRVFLSNADLQVGGAAAAAIGIAAIPFALPNTGGPNDVVNSGVKGRTNSFFHPAEFLGVAGVSFVATTRRVGFERVFSADQVFTTDTMAPEDSTASVGEASMSSHGKPAESAADPVYSSIGVTFGCRHLYSSCIQNTLLKAGAQYL